MKINIPDNVKMILDRLGAGGYSAYCVGGCVRDALLGKTPEDWDITTSALPAEIKDVFSDFKTVDTGIKHGTVAVIVDHVPYEVTTFRVDGSYSDNRHPDTVSFSGDVEDDLSRRDFTVNAMAYNEDGLVDCLGGAEDISRRIIRCVGDADRRFTEDALRIMRALRFSSVLGFEIEPGTRASLTAKKDLLKNIAMERITSELLKLITGEKFRDIFMEYHDVIFTAVPELGELYSHLPDSVLQTNLAAASLLPPDPVKRMAALTSFSGGSDDPPERAEVCKTVLRSMRLSNKFVLAACCLAGHRAVELNNDTDVKYCLGKLGYDAFFDLIELQRADAETRNDREKLLRLISAEELARQMRSDGACVRQSDLKVSGDFLAREFGLQGPQIGACLDELLRAVVEGKVQNTPSELAKFAEKITKTL
ncbi:MAG: CCA tRNA nucleotidyltransferase [Clostridiales bacterium]|nr:CCA tRNA nucleotidyltransferase [Clostridiales bacterium]